MAGDAVDRRMRSDQGEAIFVSAYGLQGYIPTDHAMALLAIRAELPPMNVGVAIGTLRAHVAEYRLCMALDAIDFGMHTPQGVAGRIVVEFRDRADRLPTRLCVAVLARNS
jgi:hypothetical protein